jgi:hypothetical protein
MSRPLHSAPTPASRCFTATTGRSAGQRRIGTPCLRVLPRHAPFSSPLGACAHTGWCIGARLLMFRVRAADRAHAASTPGTAWPIHGHLPGLSQEAKRLLVLMPPDVIFRRLIRRRRLELPPRRSGTSSRSPPDAVNYVFSLSLTTTVFSQRSTGRFGTCPRRPVPEGQLSSISYTAPQSKESSTSLLLLRS